MLSKVLQRFGRRHVEQRRSIRESVNFPAWISVGTDNPAPCTVLDVSEHGARIQVGAVAELPELVDLLFTRDGSRQRRCQIAWRSDGQIGVCYIGPVEVRGAKSGRFSAL
jgi:hypothetical protein